MTLRFSPHFACCLLALGLQGGDARAEGPSGLSRSFWVRDSGSNPATFHRTQATLRGSGAQSLVYVEDKLFGAGLSQDYVSRLEDQLERDAPTGAYATDEGLIELEATFFGPLPHQPQRDDRLIVLFADFGVSGPEAEVHDFDQAADSDAPDRAHARSNQANVIYVNGFRKTEAHTSGVIARELQKLLTGGLNAVPREAWLSESLAEGAMLLSGFFGDQDHVDDYLRSSGRFPLVTPAGAQLGPQLLFSSFLIDTLPTARGTAVGALSHLNLGGRNAVEKLVLDLTQTPLNFDAIFSNFVSYVFNQNAAGTALPEFWDHNPSVHVSQVLPYFTYKAGSGELTGTLAPYSFVAVDLAQELSSTAVIHVERITAAPAGPTSDCAQNASILWKPVHKTRIAVYAVGCDPTDPSELVQFRLRILDQPSLYLASPFKLFR